MTIVKVERASTKGLAIVEKYEDLVIYLYPILQGCPRAHGNARDAMMAALFEPVALFHQAAMSRQVSRLYAVDASLATLRFWLRFAARPSPKIISPRQQARALALLAEVGGMLNAWIDNWAAKAKATGERGK